MEATKNTRCTRSRLQTKNPDLYQEPEVPLEANDEGEEDDLNKVLLGANFTKDDINAMSPRQKLHLAGVVNESNDGSGGNNITGRGVSPGVKKAFRQTGYKEDLENVTSDEHATQRLSRKTGRPLRGRTPVLRKETAGRGRGRQRGKKDAGSGNQCERKMMDDFVQAKKEATFNSQITKAKQQMAERLGTECDPDITVIDSDEGDGDVKVSKESSSARNSNGEPMDEDPVTKTAHISTHDAVADCSDDDTQHAAMSQADIFDEKNPKSDLAPMPERNGDCHGEEKMESPPTDDDETQHLSPKAIDVPAGGKSGGESEPDENSNHKEMERDSPPLLNDARSAAVKRKLPEDDRDERTAKAQILEDEHGDPFGHFLWDEATKQAHPYAPCRPLESDKRAKRLSYCYPRLAPPNCSLAQTAKNISYNFDLYRALVREAQNALSNVYYLQWGPPVQVGDGNSATLDYLPGGGVPQRSHVFDELAGDEGYSGTKELRGRAVLRPTRQAAKPPTGLLSRGRRMLAAAGRKVVGKLVGGLVATESTTKHEPAIMEGEPVLPMNARHTVTKSILAVDSQVVDVDDEDDFVTLPRTKRGRYTVDEVVSDTQISDQECMDTAPTTSDSVGKHKFNLNNAKPRAPEEIENTKPGPSGGNGRKKFNFKRSTPKHSEESIEDNYRGEGEPRRTPQVDNKMERVAESDDITVIEEPKLLDSNGGNILDEAAQFPDIFQNKERKIARVTRRNARDNGDRAQNVRGRRKVGGRPKKNIPGEEVERPVSGEGEALPVPRRVKKSVLHLASADWSDSDTLSPVKKSQAAVEDIKTDADVSKTKSKKSPYRRIRAVVSDSDDDVPRVKKIFKQPEDTGQCPICSMTFTLVELPEHASECNGEPKVSRADEQEPLSIRPTRRRKAQQTAMERNSQMYNAYAKEASGDPKEPFRGEEIIDDSSSDEYKPSKLKRDGTAQDEDDHDDFIEAGTDEEDQRKHKNARPKKIGIRTARRPGRRNTPDEDEAVHTCDQCHQVFTLAQLHTHPCQPAQPEHPTTPMQTEPCPLCSCPVPRAKLEEHVNMCCLKDDADQERRRSGSRTPVAEPPAPRTHAQPTGANRRRGLSFDGDHYLPSTSHSGGDNPVPIQRCNSRQPYSDHDDGEDGAKSGALLSREPSSIDSSMIDITGSNESGSSCTSDSSSDMEESATLRSALQAARRRGPGVAAAAGAARELSPVRSFRPISSLDDQEMYRAQFRRPAARSLEEIQAGRRKRKRGAQAKKGRKRKRRKKGGKKQSQAPAKKPPAAKKGANLFKGM